MIFLLEPCKRDGRGRNIANYEIRDHYEKLAEELFEAHAEAVNGDKLTEAIELIDLMTVCASRIITLGIAEDDLADIQGKVIERNYERGYFTEAKNDGK